MFVCLIFLVTSSSVESAGDSFSTQYTAVLADHNITLQCGEGKQDNVSWTYEPPGGYYEPIVLFVAQEENDGRFLLKNKTGRYDLFISSAKQSHAGAYTCTIRKHSPNKATTTMNIRIELAVIISGPECYDQRSTASPEEGDYIVMECFVQFRGNVAPVMKWRNEVSKQSIASQTDEEFNRHVRSTVTLSPDQIDDGDSISCTILFNQSSHFDNHSIVSAPKFQYIWTSLPSAVTGNRSSFSSSSDFSESKWNTSPIGAKVDGESLYWSPLLISLIAVTAILAIVILIAFVVRRRGGARKEECVAEERIYYEDPAEVIETGQAQATSGLVRIFYENPTEENLNNAPQSTNDDLDNIYSGDPVVPINNDNHQSPGVGITPATDQSLGNRRRNHEYMDMDLIRDSREATATIENLPSSDAHVGISSSSPPPSSSSQLPRNGGSNAKKVDFNRIIYTEVTSPRGSDVIASSKSRQRIKPLFNKSVYAAIDHTLQT